MRNVLLTRLSLVTLCALAWAGCSVSKTETPDLAGPSEFALSFALSASPDAISQDGGSQSAIVVKAFDANGKPKSAVTFRLDMFVDQTPVDYGTLSAKTVVTGGDGRGMATYTAPAPFPTGTNLPTCSPNPFDPAVPGGCLTIRATPIGSGFTSARSQGVEIHLIPLGVIVPPAATPTADFTFNPNAPSANAPVQFDASNSCSGPKDTAGGCPAGPPVSYAWQFSDGGTAAGRLATHSFALAQTYSATLTVANDRGIKASSTKSVSVGAGSAPTAAFVYSPTPVAVGTEVYFDASNSRAGLGHTIASYSWNWGDSESAAPSPSPLQQHDYLAPGTYTVLLTVTDDAGQVGTTTQTVAVGGANPTAAFDYNVSAPLTHTVQFDASGSSASGGATITGYAWVFGDGAVLPGPSLATSHSYAAAGVYTVKLTVTDSAGKVGVISRNVTVP